MPSYALCKNCHWARFYSERGAVPPAECPSCGGEVVSSEDLRPPIAGRTRGWQAIARRLKDEPALLTQWRVTDRT